MNKERNIAIIGTAPSSLGLAPWNNNDWEMWPCTGVFKGVDILNISNLGAWFEIHDPLTIKEQFGNVDFHASLTKPVFMQEKREDVPFSERYPIEDILAMFPRKYFTNSISYMIAYAIYLARQGENIKRIGIWGVDMCVDSEYSHQRPSCEYFIGIAEGMGIEVVIPGESDLLKCALLYGYDTGERADFNLYYACNIGLG